MNQPEAYELAMRVMREIRKTIKGKDDCIERAFCAILAGGHILIEDVPGVGKTTLATAFSRVMALENHRVQFTPDVLPVDIMGFTMYDKATGSFSYHPGAVMCNLFLADEINRTSPKTQSALLEVMEEGSVTVDGVSHCVPSPFLVIATQNPKGSAGTQMLPESQMDRFMICMSMGYPDAASEIEIAKGRGGRRQADMMRPVMSAMQLEEMKAVVDEIFIHDNIYKYMVRLVRSTRENSYIELGVSPRGMVALANIVRARAFLQGRGYCVPEDVDSMFLDVTKHRILLNTKARVAGVSADAILEQILSDTQKPTSYRGKTEL